MRWELPIQDKTIPDIKQVETVVRQFDVSDEAGEHPGEESEDKV